MLKHMYSVSMTHTLCRTCKTLKADVDFLGVRAPFTCIACNTEPLIQGKVCPACEEFRHLKLFRYPLTLAQAEARGYYNHEERPMHATSKFCEPCRTHRKRGTQDLGNIGPKHIRPADLPRLTRRQLNVELTRGRIKPALIEAEILKRDKNRAHLRREAGALGAAKRWEKHDDARWGWVAQELSRELQRVANKFAYTRHAALDEDDPLARAKWKFYITYRRTLRAARTKARAGLGAATDGKYTWASLLNPNMVLGYGRMALLVRRWAALDHVATTERKRGRPPLVPMLLERRDDDLFKGCPIQTRTERVAPPKEPAPFKLYVHKPYVDNSWDN
jgi:hypothetical protein